MRANPKALTRRSHVIQCTSASPTDSSFVLPKQRFCLKIFGRPCRFTPQFERCGANALEFDLQHNIDKAQGKRSVYLFCSCIQPNKRRLQVRMSCLLYYRSCAFLPTASCQWLVANSYRSWMWRLPGLKELAALSSFRVACRLTNRTWWRQKAHLSIQVCAASIQKNCGENHVRTGTTPEIRARRLAKSWCQNSRVEFSDFAGPDEDFERKQV